MNFEWELDEEAESNDPKSYSDGPEPRPRRWGMLIAGVFVAAILAGLGWWRISLFDQETISFLQSAVDLQSSAVLQRDGDLYFTNYGGEPNLLIHEMHPKQIEFWLSSPQIKDYEQVELEIWAQAEWKSSSNETLYRTLFFNDWNGSVRLKSESTAYWQSVYTVDFDAFDGTLALTERDRPFENQLMQRLSNTLDTYCANQAQSVCADLQVSVGPSTFLPSDEFEFISPRLYGLTVDAEIPQSYWEYFDQRLLDLTDTATIRFGMPDTISDRVISLVEKFEQEQAAAGKNISVELISFHPGRVDYPEFLKTVDGAYLAPTLDIVASGAVLPISNLTAGMHTSFFGQHWAGAWWQDQVWFLPLNGELTFVSTDFGYASDFGNPSVAYPDWNWDEFETVMNTYTAENGLEWGIAIPNPGLLLSRAYGVDHTCSAETLPISCSIDLSQAGIESAMAFYAANGQKISVPPAGSIEDQINHFVTQASVSVGHSAMWASRPVFYEHDLTTRNAFVQPLPRFENQKPIYPLLVNGGVISSFSDSPLSTWEFVEFLSFHEVNSAERTVPARFSVVTTNGFWNKIPQRLRPLMQEGFNQSRPMRIGEMDYFRPEVLSKVADGSLTPEDAARQRPPVRWFSAYFSEQQQAN